MPRREGFHHAAAQVLTCGMTWIGFIASPNSQFRRPGARVLAHLGFRGSDWLARHDAHRTLVPADANGRLGRTDTVCCFDVEKVLCNLVLEGVEGDDPYAPTACKHCDGSPQPFLDPLQLAVHRDA